MIDCEYRVADFHLFKACLKIARYTVEQFRETDKQRIYVYAIKIE